MISVVKGIFFGSTDFNFRKIEFSGPTKQPHFRKSISGSDFHPKQTQPKWKTKLFPIRKNYYRCILHIYKGEVPWNYFVIAIPGSKTVRMLLNNESYTVKSMLRICGVVSYLCKTSTKVLHLSQSKNNYKSYFFKEQMNRSIFQWRNPSKWDYIFWTNNEIINLKEKRGDQERNENVGSSKKEQVLWSWGLTSSKRSKLFLLLHRQHAMS